MSISVSSRLLCRHVLKKNLLRFSSTVEYPYIAKKRNKAFVDLYSDPSNQLQKWLKIPLFREDEKPFTADKKAILQAKRLYKSSKTHEIKFVRSVFDNPEHYPVYAKANLPEVLFLGRSNCGKSSLIQAFFKHDANLVRISKIPGHTKLLNFFKAGDKFVLVDAPGYGENEPENYRPAVETYLATRNNLRRTFLLVDASLGIVNRDILAIEMLENSKRPFALVMTKIDKTPISLQLTNLLELQRIRDKNSFSYCYPQPFLVSGITHEGLGFLQAFIAHVTSDVDLDNNSTKLGTYSPLLTNE